MIDVAEREAREYELAIKRGKFEKECPYPKIIEIYKNIREKVYAKGWVEEAKLYTDQIIRYQEKLKKDKNLRELEAEKVKTEVRIISTETREGVQLRDIGKVAAILRYEVNPQTINIT